MLLGGRYPRMGHALQTKGRQSLEKYTAAPAPNQDYIKSKKESSAAKKVSHHICSFLVNNLPFYSEGTNAQV